MAVAEAHPPPWMVCEAVFAETDHLLSPAGRHALRTAIRRGALHPVAVLSDETISVLALLDKYQDVPMSAADACVARLTETLPDPLVLTTDPDFKIYRRHGRKVIPCLLP